jgi:CRISPR system Cascade subunit CasE
MNELWMTRARLRRDASVAALMPLISGTSQAHSGHSLIWSLFADGPDRRRDFLWRENGEHTYYILSSRPPVNALSMFDMDDPKAFAPQLAVGDPLHFSLRANPVVRREIDELRSNGRHKRTKKVDVVMKAIHDVPKGSRAEPRRLAIREAGLRWLDAQAGRCGFAVQENDVGVDGYEQNAFGGQRSRGAMKFSVLDFDGRLTITEPSVFLQSIARGLGSAKAFGCGLMLIRRA